ncbi:MAG: hypothetical protein HYW70_03580 [Candidatus Nealsonbacteria bacterium]|nr:hypothetical protein [Candidatus Nealsonbacteria bacterium]
MENVFSTDTMRQMMQMWGSNMMGMGQGGFASWLITSIYVVWLIVGILVAIWLWKQITKK